MCAAKAKRERAVEDDYTNDYMFDARVLNRDPNLFLPFAICADETTVDKVVHDEVERWAA